MKMNNRNSPSKRDIEANNSSSKNSNNKNTISNKNNNKISNTKSSNSNKSNNNNNKTNNKSNNINDIRITIDKKNNKKYSSINKNNDNNNINNSLVYGKLAHYLSLSSSLLCIVMGVYSYYWNKYSSNYNCLLSNGISINNDYIGSYNDNTNTDNDNLICSTVIDNHYICCNPYINNHKDIHGNHIIPNVNIKIAILYIIYGIIIIIIIENTLFGYGLYYPKESYSYRYKISPSAIVHMAIGIVGLFDIATVLAGSCLIITSIIYQYTVYIGEYIDGNDNNTSSNGNDFKLKFRPSMWTCTEICSLISDNCETVYFLIKRYSEFGYNHLTKYLNIYNHFQYIYYNGMITLIIWVLIIFISNSLLFSYTLYEWYDIIDKQEYGLVNGTLDIYCNDKMCKMNRKIIKYGPLSNFYPWAKAFGICLNMNCSLIFFTIIPFLFENIQNIHQGFSKNISKNGSNNIIMRILATPLSNYIPIKDMFTFHYIYAIIIMIFSIGHTICHYSNIITSNEATMFYIRKWDWDGTCYFTGSIIVISMLIIYAGTCSSLIHLTHYLSWIFIIILMLHSKEYFIWSLFPISLYLLEIYCKRNRITKNMMITGIDMISSFTLIKFKPSQPLIKDFTFEEGSYVYVNCPSISKTEWYSFPINSIVQDLNNSRTRIELVSNERVIPAPRPLNLPNDSKWNKYIKVSQDLKTLESVVATSPTYIDKHETGYDEFFSILINTDTNATKEGIWIKKLIKYLDNISLSVDKDDSKTVYPRYFYSYDNRGDIEIGMKTPVLKIDGPYNHGFIGHYSKYNTLMLIANSSDNGKGLIYCSSLLSNIVKHNWINELGPSIVHFYWIIEEHQILSYLWFLYEIQDLSFEFKKLLESNPDRHTYLEINIYIEETKSSSIKKKNNSKVSSPKSNANNTIENKFRRDRGYNELTGFPIFTIDDLYNLMNNPSQSSKGQIDMMKNQNPTNRLQECWIWKGQPIWDEIFVEVNSNRVDKTICVMNTCKDQPSTTSINDELHKAVDKHNKSSEFKLYSYNNT